MPDASPPDARDLADHFEAVREFFRDRIPLHALLGIDVEHVGPGTARLRLPFRPELVGDPTRPSLHGGLVATLADGAAATAVCSASGPGDRISTIDLRVDYLRPAGPADVWAEAEVVRLGGRVAAVRVSVAQVREEGPPGAPERHEVASCTAVYSLRRRDEGPADPDESRPAGPGEPPLAPR